MDHVILQLDPSEGGRSFRIPESCPEGLRAALSQAHCCGISLDHFGALALYNEEQWQEARDRLEMNTPRSPSMKEMTDLFFSAAFVLERGTRTFYIPDIMLDFARLEEKAALVLDEGQIYLMRPEQMKRPEAESRR